MPVKVIEVKGLDWPKGISAQPNAPIGGLHQQLLGCDPFEFMGIAQPSLSPASISLGTIPKFLTNYNASSVGYVLAQSNTKLYQILKDSPYTVVDKTSSITPTGNIDNAVLWNAKYVYAQDDLRAWNLAASDVQLLASFNDSNSMDFRPLCVGADGNLYCGDKTYIRLITNSAGTSGNGTTFQIDSLFVVRALLNDGRYLVVVADNNADASANLQPGDYRCRIYFWDMVKTSNAGANLLPDVLWDIKDSYITAAQFLEGGVFLWGRSGLYVCNAASSPKMLRPFIGTNTLLQQTPLNAAQTTVSKGSLFWVDGGTNSLLQGIINAYGNPITGQKKIFYQPYLNGGNSQQTCLQTVGDQYWMGNNASLIYVHNIGSTRGQLSARSLNVQMEVPHTFEYSKVVLNQPLSSGQTVQHIAYGANGSITVSSGETKSYSASNPKQTLLFRRNGTSATQEKFNDLSVSIVTTGGASLQRVSAYATPLEDANEDL